ncbi:MAG: BNR repeat-containing protein [Ferruginibacter sp.]
MKLKNLLVPFSILLMSCFVSLHIVAQQKKLNVKLIAVDSGWAANSVNTTVFRKNSLASHGDTQFIAFYNQQQYVVLGKRKLGSNKWILKQTQYKGNTADAHNVISLAIDGKGYLHLSWDHHNDPIRYCKSVSPGSLELTDKMPMTNQIEQLVSYPEFYNLPNGDLLFFFRNGESGQGNLVINYYNSNTGVWKQLQSNLVDGEGQRNAYWQACVDKKGAIHISWVWRETGDVASNHDLCYARSLDGGISWEKSSGEKYTLPITKATAEYTAVIPQNSELINQTSMTADESGHPYIATYYRDSGTMVPQYHVVFFDGKRWVINNTGFRKTAFSLKGVGTKRIPIARPQILTWQKNKNLSVALVFRDEERGSKVSLAICNDLKKGGWQLEDLTQESVGSWEPSYDTELWKHKKILNLFVQHTEQIDGEGRADMPPQMVQVLWWNPVNN